VCVQVALNWQSNGDYLGCRVMRRKGKKQQLASMEIFKVMEKGKCLCVHFSLFRVCEAGRGREKPVAC
jgi:hypothetical protein